jgi:hypothetical protein
MKLRSAVRVFATAVLTLSFTGVASAAFAHCPTGFVCGWDNAHFAAAHAIDDAKEGDYHTFAFEGTTQNTNDRFNSLRSQFTRCKARFYADTGYQGSSITLNYPAIGAPWQDDDLGNGFPGTASSWNNRISSHQDVFCA